jgi:putative aminopeptidase
MKLQSRLVLVIVGIVCVGAAEPAMAQYYSGPEGMPAAVSGYEQQLASELRSSIKGFSPQTDNLGNVYVTLGSGAPHRMIVTPIDQPGYLVSEITAEGYLRVQRLPQRAPNAVFDLLHAAQPVWVMTRDAKRIPGVFSGLSVHLQPARQNPPTMAHPDDMYVDIGAASAQEVRAAGVDILDPISLAQFPQVIGTAEMAGPGVGDGFGRSVLLELLRVLAEHKENIPGQLTIAFATQQWIGERGLDRLLNELHPDELIYVGRIMPPRFEESKPSLAHEAIPPGSGVLIGVSDTSAALAGLAAELKKIGDDHEVRIQPVTAAPPGMASYAKARPLPTRFAHLSVASLYPVTPAETINTGDVSALRTLIYWYIARREIPRVEGGRQISRGMTANNLRALTETYGASGHEEAVRERVKKLLPSWAKTETDAAGNLVLKMGNAIANSKAPRLVFVAHLDEIGYQVRSIESDGSLLMDVLGGGYPEYFLGHVMLLHKADGNTVGGVLELPAKWDQPGFEWPHGPKAMDEPAHLYVGTHSAEETQKLGIKVGDWATVPKQYRALISTRANARSFDDRVGCAALIEAVRELGQNLGDRQVTFIWSTEEEVGLKGAAAAAAKMAAEGSGPDFVFAIDTFVSSDSPIESKRFADAELGKGFVIRAVDNSNIAPREYVDRVVKLARENKIPVQYGVTGGGNDGAVFVRYGAVDVPLSWPLRYAHSAAEVIDTRDYDALVKIVVVLAQQW